jgi:hypothetical protein
VGIGGLFLSLPIPSSHMHTVLLTTGTCQIFVGDCIYFEVSVAHIHYFSVYLLGVSTVLSCGGWTVSRSDTLVAVGHSHSCEFSSSSHGGRVSGTR